MTPEQIQQVIDQLFKMGGFLSTEAFRIALQQVKLEATTELIWGILLLILTVASAVSLWKIYHSEWWDYHSDEIGPGFCIAVLVLATILFPIISMGLFTDTYMYSTNPEWYAVKLLLNLVSGN